MVTTISSKGLPIVQLLIAGRLPYLPALKLQQILQTFILQQSSSCSHTLIIVEHEPVYTLGFRERLDPSERDRLLSTGASVVSSDRGGLSTFHGPGQLVAYPIIHLSKFYKNSDLPLRTFVSKLETVAVHTCRLLGVPAIPSTSDVSHTGSWVNDNKICAIGVHCKRYITTHGLALNCNVDLSWFKHIVPCGIKDKGVTSLSQELDDQVSPENALPPLLASFQNVFNCKIQEMDKSEAQSLVHKALIM